jgi:hypothetical protein
MLGESFKRLFEANKAALEMRVRQAEQRAYAARFSHPSAFVNCTFSDFPPPAQVVDLIEIDGVWQLPPDAPMHEAKAG